MHIIDSAPFALSCYPQAPSRAIRDIDVRIEGAKNGGLKLTFSLAGDISALRIPEPRPPRRSDNLWHHTCFEVFVMAGEGPEYREFNFSPSGEWAVYDFQSYRNAREPESILENEYSAGIVVHKAMDRLELCAEISQGLLPPGRPLRLGLSAVVEDVDGIISYWALRHPPGKPDFHHSDAFVIPIEKI